jgi:hypothetical protein
MGDLRISNYSNWGDICRDVVGGAGPSGADTKKGVSFSACSALLEAEGKAREAQSMTREDPAKAAARYREAADLAACADPGLAAYYLRGPASGHRMPATNRLPMPISKSTQARRTEAMLVRHVAQVER